jgi:hypothetical protein
MKRIGFNLGVLVSAFCAGALFASDAGAIPAIDPAPPAFFDDSAKITPVGADCYVVGQQVAAQNGGTLAKASASTQNGKAVCVVVVLVPGKDGARPRRAEIVVPQN